MPRYLAEVLQENALKSLHNFRMALDVKANDKNKYKKICEQLSVEIPYFEFSIKPYNPETGKARIINSLAKSNDVWKFVAKNKADISISDENLIDFEVRTVALMQQLEAMRIPTKNFKIENSKSEHAKRLTPSLFNEIKKNVASIMANKNALSGGLREAKMATLWGADSEHNIFKKVHALYKDNDLVYVIKSLLKEKNDLKIELSRITHIPHHIKRCFLIPFICKFFIHHQLMIPPHRLNQSSRIAGSSIQCRPEAGFSGDPCQKTTFSR